jgi:hypothetical protein
LAKRHRATPCAAQAAHWNGVSLLARHPTRVVSQLIAILKDYWLPIVVAFAALGLWMHHKITALLDDDEE